MVFDWGSIFAHGRCSSVRSSAGWRYRSSAGRRYCAGSSAGWRCTPVVSLAGGDFVRIPYMFIISFLFEFLIPVCNPIPPRAGPLPFWCWTSQGRTSTSRRCSSPRTLGGRRCVHGLVGLGLASEGSRLDRAVSSAARRRAPVVLVSLAGGGTRHVFPACLSFLFCLTS